MVNGSPRKLAKRPVAIGVVEGVQAQPQALASLGSDESSRGFERQVFDSLRARDQRYRWKGERDVLFSPPDCSVILHHVPWHVLSQCQHKTRYRHGQEWRDVLLLSVSTESRRRGVWPSACSAGRGCGVLAIVVSFIVCPEALEILTLVGGHLEGMVVRVGGREILYNITCHYVTVL